jgi:hypothetical protein
MEESKPKKSIGLGVGALVISILGALLALSLVISFFNYGIFSVNITTIYAAIGLSLLAIILGKIVEHLEHSDEKYGSTAVYISESVLTSFIALYIVVKYLL